MVCLEIRTETIHKKWSVQCLNIVSGHASIYQHVIKTLSMDSRVICDLASSNLFSSHLMSSHLILYSLCFSHHLSSPERTKPTHSHPRTFALAVLLFKCSSVFLQSFCITDFFSAFWPQTKCHLSLSIVPDVPYPHSWSFIIAFLALFSL